MNQSHWTGPQEITSWAHLVVFALQRRVQFAALAMNIIMLQTELFSYVFIIAQNVVETGIFIKLWNSEVFVLSVNRNMHVSSWYMHISHMMWKTSFQKSKTAHWWASALWDAFRWILKAVNFLMSNAPVAVSDRATTLCRLKECSQCLPGTFFQTCWSDSCSLFRFSVVVVGFSILLFGSPPCARWSSTILLISINCSRILCMYSVYACRMHYLSALSTYVLRQNMGFWTPVAADFACLTGVHMEDE